MSHQTICVRQAKADDIHDIHELLDYYGNLQKLLPRSYDDIQQKLDNFLVVEVDQQFAGCVAIRDFGNNLFEVRSLAVKADFTKMGLGSTLVKASIDRCKLHGSGRLFALTHHPNIFLRLNFKLVEKEIFPEKIWADCSACPKIDDCDEVAVLFEIS